MTHFSYVTDKELRGLPFYNVDGNPLCEQDYLVSHAFAFIFCTIAGEVRGMCKNYSSLCPNITYVNEGIIDVQNQISVTWQTKAQGKLVRPRRFPVFCNQKSLVHRNQEYNTIQHLCASSNSLTSSNFPFRRIHWKNVLSANDQSLTASSELQESHTIQHVLPVLSVENVLMAFPLRLTMRIEYTVSKTSIESLLLAVAFVLDQSFQNQDSMKQFGSSR